VRVYPFKAPTSTTKVERDINPAYLGATYQDTIVHIPAVYTCLMETPDPNPGGGRILKATVTWATSSSWSSRTRNRTRAAKWASLMLSLPAHPSPAIPSWIRDSTPELQPVWALKPSCS
jgi:hypothetical protein